MAKESTNFEQDVIARSREVPVLCDFWAPWCGPCRMLGPALEQLAGEAAGRWELVKVNVDENPRPAQQYGIRGIPAVKLFHHGEVVAEFTGVQPAETLRKWIEDHLPSAEKDRQREAEKALAELRFAKAEELLRDGAEDPRGRWLLAKALLWKDPQEAMSLVRDLDPSLVPEREAEAVRRLAATLLAPEPQQGEGEGANGELFRRALAELKEGQLANAMEHLTHILWDQPGFRGGEAVRLQQALLLYLGLRHPLSEQHYRAYSSAASLV